MSKGVCSIDGCDRDILARGYCSKHYDQKKKAKEFPTKSRLCTIAGCELVHESKGFCSKHYSRFKKYGDPLFTINGRGLEKHGMNGTSEYITWCGMKERCFNKNHTHYKRYGGRGITVCNRWKNSFIAFYEDMGDKPFKKAQLDRIDNDGNYEPGNCRWVSRQDNMRHTSKSKLTMVQAREIRSEYTKGNISQRKLAVKYGVSQANIKNIIKNYVWKEA